MKNGVQRPQELFKSFQSHLRSNVVHVPDTMQSRHVLLLAFCAAVVLTAALAAPAGYIRKESEARHGSHEWTRKARSHASQVIPLQIAIKQSNVDQLLVRI